MSDFYELTNLKRTIMTSLATTSIEVYVEQFDNGFRIDEWGSEFVVPKSWGFSQRFMWLKNHFRKLTKEEGLTYQFEILG